MDTMEPQKPEKHTDLKHLLAIVLLLVLVGALVVWVYLAAGPEIFSTKLKKMGNQSGNVTSNMKELTEADDSANNPVPNDRQIEEELNLMDENSDLKDLDNALNQLEQVDLSDIDQTYQ